MSLIQHHPWFPFVLAFVLLLGAWTSMIVIALKNRVEEVPLEQAGRPTPVDPTQTHSPVSK